jgi:LPXTG-site transpeptidase (sortase) family protein
MQLISKIFITIGFVFILLGALLLWERNNPLRISFKEYTPTNYSNYNVTPKRILVKSLNIDLPIIEATIENNKWTTTNKGVSYLVDSPVPGLKGNSILYGHNWNNLLGNLKYAHPGEIIEIAYSDGTIKQFSINTMGVVTPNETHVLLPSKDVRITLYTCTGFLDTKRLVVTALLKNTISTTQPLAEGGLSHE